MLERRLRALSFGAVSRAFALDALDLCRLQKLFFASFLWVSLTKRKAAEP